MCFVYHTILYIHTYIYTYIHSALYHLFFVYMLHSVLYYTLLVHTLILYYFGDFVSQLVQHRNGEIALRLLELLQEPRHEG